MNFLPVEPQIVSDSSGALVAGGRPVTASETLAESSRSIGLVTDIQEQTRRNLDDIAERELVYFPAAIL